MQALLPPFTPALFKTLVQLKQIPSITEFIVGSQEQVKVLGSQINVAWQSQMLLVTVP
jgi:hypothetical protein